MSMARLVITAVVVEGRTKSEVARDYGMSRYWVQTLVKRFAAEGEAAFEPRSRRPHSSPNQVSAELEDRIIRLRKELTKKGVDAGADTIRSHLARGRTGCTGRTARSATRAGSADLPAVSTIWRVLTRRGFVTPQPRKRPRSSYRRFQADLPNERWQADATHWQLADRRGRVLRKVEIINILDDHSRLDVASDAYPTATGADAVRSFRKGFRRHGIPASTLTDNGAIFTGKPRRGGRVALETELGALGVKTIHSRPYHPQTCGKVERFHQTQKKWLAAQPPAATIAELQKQLDAFRRYYNTVRPHRALGRRTPAEANAARPKAVPAGPVIDPHYRVRTDRVDISGVVTLRHNSRLHHIGLGRARARTRVTMLIDDLHIRVLDADTGELIRDLVLDPSRDYQPTGRPPGPPRKPA